MSQYGDDSTAEFGAYPAYDEEPPRRRRKTGVILLSVAVAVVLLGCGILAALAKGSFDGGRPAAQERVGDGSKPIGGYSAPPATTEAPVAIVETSSAPPSKAPSKTPSKAATKKPSPKVTETVTPPAPPHNTCTPVRGANQLPKATVKGYLDTAAAKHFWGTKTDPDYEQILVPTRLLYAVAEQESGWQSDIKACDGGLGVMQVMPDTMKFINQRFGASWDYTVPQQNVMCGANYLAWLIAFYGPKLGTYDMTDPKLLGAVISAYNWGTGGVDYANVVYPNPQYVQNVKALMVASRAGNY
ncbi:transglycosylase SLT domain-containing protein [Dactylosporangium sp. NPDC051541]|uniref:transglycosylase SLT domain-containing protein n=1 Tax=Dactylosporangium sp. NPDC051541 TaxID=3363977 RepID=UPI0037AAF2D9